MTLLLDTNTAIWLLEDSPRLGRSATRACDAALRANELIVPSVVFYEVGQLVRYGRLRSFVSVRDWRAAVLALGLREAMASAEVAIRASEFENLHDDPVDRLIMATAVVEGAVLLTADGLILAWPGQLRRQDARR